MKSRIILAVFVIPLGLIIAAVPTYKTLSSNVTPKEILSEVRSGAQIITTDEVAEMIIAKDPSLLLIDIRSPEEFEKFNLPGALNIPIDNILSDEWIDIFDQNIKMNVLYGNGTTKSNEAWMILRQLGFENNYVLQGGLNYWAETIMNPKPPSNINPDDEIAKYDFRKGAGQALGGASISVNQGNESTTKKAVVKRKKKKKRVAGGC